MPATKGHILPISKTNWTNLQLTICELLLKVTKKIIINHDVHVRIKQCLSCQRIALNFNTLLSYKPSEDSSVLISLPWLVYVCVIS